MHKGYVGREYNIKSNMLQIKNREKNATILFYLIAAKQSQNADTLFLFLCTNRPLQRHVASHWHIVALWIIRRFWVGSRQILKRYIDWYFKARRVPKKKFSKINIKSTSVWATNLSITFWESSFSLIESAAALTPSKHRLMMGATAVSALAAPQMNSFRPRVRFSSISCNLLNTCANIRIGIH